MITRKLGSEIFSRLGSLLALFARPFREKVPFRILIAFLLFQPIAAIQAQTLGEVLRAVQNRALVQGQKASVYHDLVANTTEPPSITLIDWGIGQDFPSDSTLNSLAITEKVQLLRLAFSEMIKTPSSDLYRHAGLLGDGGEIDRLGSLISVENFPVMLKKISRLLKSNTTFDWPLYGKRKYSSFAKTGLTTPPVSPLTAETRWSHTARWSNGGEEIPVVSGKLNLPFGISGGAYESLDPQVLEYAYAGSITYYADLKTKAPASFPGKLQVWTDPTYGANAVEGLTWPYVAEGNTENAFYEPGPHKCVEADISAGAAKSIDQLSGIFAGQLSGIKFPFIKHEAPAWYFSSAFGKQENNVLLSSAYGWSEWFPMSNYRDYLQNPDYVWGYSLLTICSLLDDAISLKGSLAVNFGNEFTSELPQVPEEFPRLQVVPDFAKYGFTIPLATSAGNECALVFTSRPTRRIGDVSNEYGATDGTQEEYTSRPGLNARSILSVKGTGNWEAIYSGKVEDREVEFVWAGLYSDQNARWGNFDDYIAEWWKPVLCQLKTSTCGVQVVQDGAQYQIKFYRLDQVGAKNPATGRFTFSEPAVETFTVAHSTGDEAAYDVTITGSRAQYKIKSSHEVLDDQTEPGEETDGSDIFKVHWEYSAKDLGTNAIVLSKTADISEANYVNEDEGEFCKMVENTSMDGGALSTVTTTYLAGIPTNDKIDKIEEKYGETTRTTNFSYDEEDALTEIRRTGGRDPYTASYQNGLLTRYVSGQWDVGISYSGNVIVRTEKYSNSIVRTSRSTFSGDLASSTTTVDETSDEVPAFARFKSGADPLFPWGPDCFRSYDGTLTTYQYARNGNDFVVTAETGRGSTPTAETVAAGIRTVAKIAPSGKLISLKSYRIPGDTEIESVVATAYMPTTTFPTSFQTPQGTVHFTYEPTGQVATYTDLLNKQTVYTPDALGRPVSVKRGGITASYAYQGLVATVSLGSGKSFSVTHGGFGELTGASYHWRDSSGTLEQEGEGYNATSTQNLGDRTVTASINKFGIPTGSGGNAAEAFDYKVEVDEARFKTTATHKPGGSSSGVAFVRYIDALGRTQKEEVPSPSGGTATTTYNYTDGRLTSVIDPDGVATLVAYDAAGTLTTVAADLNRNEEIDSGDRVTKSVTAAGSTGIETILSVQDEGSERVVERRVFHPNTNTVDVHPDGVGDDSPRKVTISLVRSGATETLKADRGSLGETTVVFEDGALKSGSLKSDNTPSPGFSRSFVAELNNFGEWQSVTGSGTGPGTLVEFHPVTGVPTKTKVGQREFNIETNTQTGGGLKIDVTGGEVQSNLWNAKGDLLESTGNNQIDFALTPTSYAGGQISRTLTVGGKNTEFSTNHAGGDFKKTFPDGATEGATYSEGGRLLTSTNARGQTTTYQRPNGVDVEQVSVPGSPVTVGLSWRRDGQIRSIADESGTRTFGYVNGQLNTVAYSGDIFGGKVITYSRDAEGRLSGVSVTDGENVTYGYNGLQLTSVTNSSAGRTGSFSGDALPNGVPRVLNYGPVKHEKTYNGNGEYTGIKNTAGSFIHEFTYEYVNGKRKVIHANYPNGNFVWDLEYDSDSGQLIEAVPRPGSIPLLSYSYPTDAVGNPTGQTAGGYTSSFSAGPAGLNQIAGRTNPKRSFTFVGAVNPAATVKVNGIPATPNSVSGVFQSTIPITNDLGQWVPVTVVARIPEGGDDGRDAVEQKGYYFRAPPIEESFSYDADGNRWRDAKYTYGFDAENQLKLTLSRATEPNEEAPLAVRHFYDFEGRRFRKLVLRGDTTISDTYFLYDGWRLLWEQEKNGSNGVVYTRSYAWGPDLSGTLDGAGGIGGLLEIRETRAGSTNRYIPYFDGCGNVTGLVDAASGQGVAVYKYGVFGDPVSAEGPAADSCPLRFSTKYYDKETGYYYYGHRFYDPTTRAWLSRDPLGEAGGVNLYAYCNNDPVNFIDPNGLEPISTESAGTIWDLLTNPDSVTWHRKLLLLADVEESWLSYKTNPAEVFIGSLGASATRLYAGLTPSGLQAAHAAGVEKTSNVMAESMVNGDGLFWATMNGVSYNLGNVTGSTPLMQAGFGVDVGTDEFLMTGGVSMISTGERWRLGVQGSASMFLMGTSVYGSLAPANSGMRAFQLAPNDVQMLRNVAALTRSTASSLWTSTQAAGTSGMKQPPRSIYGGTSIFDFSGNVVQAGAASQRIAYLYQKVGALGQHLKYGITYDPATRYTAAELAGGRLRLIASGPRSEMLKLERSLHETMPIGVEELQEVYIGIQVRKGLLPPSEY